MPDPNQPPPAAPRALSPGRDLADAINQMERSVTGLQLTVRNAEAFRRSEVGAVGVVPYDLPIQTDMSHDEAIERLRALRAKQYAIASTGHARHKIREVIDDQRLLDQTSFAASAARRDASAALDVEALTLAIQILGGAR